MLFKNKQQWDEIVEVNKGDFYGEAIIRYAQRWAETMEGRLVNGGTVKDVAESASHGADTEDITGFMYSVAAKILSRTWAHGEELRQWFNLHEQIGDEGERANREGGILNTALLICNIPDDQMH